MKKILSSFYPDRMEASVFDINFEKLYEDGIRGLIFDIDNTLVPHGEDASVEIENLFKRLEKIGFKTCLMSNNKAERVHRFNKNIKTKYIYNAKKPSKKNYRIAIEKLGTDRHSTVFVGDQLFTDIWGARRSGIKNILLQPINEREEIQIRLKRYLENIILNLYKKERLGQYEYNRDD